MIDALAVLAENVRPVLLFVGSDEGARTALQARIDQGGVGETVRFSGWVSDEELAELYRTCTATVSASLYEGYGLPVAESLSYGIPTIASDIAAFREVAAGAAAYFETGNLSSLASVIHDVMTDEQLRANLGRQAAERSTELGRLQPTWRNVIEDATSLLDDRAE